MNIQNQEYYKRIKEGIEEAIRRNVKPDRDFRRILDQQISHKIRENVSESNTHTVAKGSFFRRGKWHISFASVIFLFLFFGGVAFAAIPQIRNAVVETIAPTHGTLIVKTDPVDVEVLITSVSGTDLDKVAKTPLEINLPSGTYEVRLEKENYIPITTLITIEKGENATIQKTLNQSETTTTSLANNIELIPFISPSFGITFSYPNTWNVDEQIDSVIFTEKNTFVQLLTDIKPADPGNPITDTQNVSVSGQIITINIYETENEVIILTGDPIIGTSRDYYFTFTISKDYNREIIFSMLESIQIVILPDGDINETLNVYEISATGFYDSNGNGLRDNSESIVNDTDLEIVMLNVPEEPQVIDNQKEYYYTSSEGVSENTQTGIANFKATDPRDENIYRAFAIKKSGRDETYDSSAFRNPRFGDVLYPIIIDISKTSNVDIPFYFEPVEGGLEVEMTYNAELTIDFFIDENGNGERDEEEDVLEDSFVLESHLIRNDGRNQASIGASSERLHFTNLPYGTYTLQYIVQPESGENYVVSNFEHPQSSLVQNEKPVIRLVPKEDSHFLIPLPVKF